MDLTNSAKNRRKISLIDLSFRPKHWGVWLVGWIEICLQNHPYKAWYFVKCKCPNSYSVHDPTDINTYFPLRLCMWKCCYLYTYTYNIIICTLVVIYVSKNTCTPSKLQVNNFQVSFCLTFYRRIGRDILHDSIAL